MKQAKKPEPNPQAWRPAVPRYENHVPKPGRKWPKVPEGQDYDTLTAKHGRPLGPFDRDRKVPYRGGGFPEDETA